MPQYDTGFKIVARTAGKQLAALAGRDCTRWRPMVSELQTTERLADRVFRAAHGHERFIVYMEAYTYWNRSVPWSVLAKSALLSERERLPTWSLVFILRPRGYRPQGDQFRLTISDEVTQQDWFREICFWEQEPQPWWEEVPGLMALYPLTCHGRRPTQAVTHAAEIITAREPDNIIRADLLTTLGIFGKLAYPHLNVGKLIGREQLKESKFYQEIKQEGRLEGDREMVLNALQVRFGNAAAELAPRINAVDDADRLVRLLALAIRCKKLDEFQRRFDQT